MIQKILRVGTSAAVTIPKHVLHEMTLKPGDTVTTDFEKQSGSFRVVKAKSPKNLRAKRDEHIMDLTLKFVHRYRKDLEALRDK